VRFWKKLRRRRELDRDLEYELQFHLEMSGRARFGNPTLIKERSRDLWTFTTIEGWWHDIRYAIRTLAKNPGVTVVALIALAIGIGADTSVFTVVNAAFSFDFGGIVEPERLVLIQPGEGLRDASKPNRFLDYLELRSQVKSITHLAAFELSSMNLSDATGLPEMYRGARISPGAFETMRRQPALGRGFTAQDFAAPVVVLSHAIWQDRYGRDAGIIGRSLRVDDVARTVIGVMPPGVRFPESAEIWVPLNPAAARNPFLFGRLADGVKIAAARAELGGIAQRTFKTASSGPLISVQPLLEIYGVYAMRPLFIAQLVAVGFVLLIACANVANLLLARAAGRAREISIRIAIGAGRARIIRQLLIESLALSIAGGFLGWMVAIGGLRWMDRFTLAQGRPPWVDLSMNARVFIYLAAISLGTGILFGLAPALRLAKVDVNSAVKDGAGASAGARGRRLSNALVIFEMALCVVLLAGAGLLIRSSLNVYSAPTGVNSANVLTVHINLPQARYPRAEDQIAFHRELKARLEALPGVESAAVASAMPSWGYGVSTFLCEIEGEYIQNPVVQGLVAGADYFRVMQAPPFHGRIFMDSEKEAIVVNGIFAAKYLPGEDPLGKHVKIGETWRIITGVVPDIQQNATMERTPLIYIPFVADARREVFIALRTRVPPATLVEASRKQVQSIDANLPLYDVRTLEDRISTTRLNVGALGVIFTIFAGIALVLACVGLYAVSAHSVSQRTREIGVRMAMGGSANSIVALVFAQGMWQIGIGLALGLPAAIGVTRVLRGSLVGVSPFDPVTFVGVIATLAIAGAVGCAIPARRAVRVDPVVALRCE
jgi:putative ABC transport system permease protein